MTAEQIFLKPSQYRTTLPSFREIRSYPYLFHKEFLNLVKSETDWIDQPVELADIPREQWEQIGLREVECPRCRGGNSYEVPVRGETTGLNLSYTESCACEQLHKFWYRWKNTPSRFRHIAGIGQLTPSPKSLLSIARQQEIIDTIKDKPKRSYLLWGAAGTGKTHITASLYRAHLTTWAVRSTDDEAWHAPLWRVSAPVLMEQWVRKSTDPEAPTPDVSERSIAHAGAKGQRPVLFLDEIDKVKGSDFKMEKLRAIVDSVYEAEGQIVATSNASPADIAQRWGGEWGDIILRRIAAPPEGRVIHFETAG